MKSKCSKIGKKVLLVIFTMACSAFGSHAQAMEIYNKENNSLNLFGRIQFLGAGNYVPNETVRRPVRSYVFLPQSRLGIYGSLGDWKYYTELAFGGEEGVTSNVSLSMLDYRFDVPLAKGYYLRVGQFKVFNSREWATDDGGLQFANRSISNLGTNFGRDVGMALVGRSGTLSGALGVFTGGGMNVPQRYLPEDLGVPLIALRVGLDGTPDDATANNPAGNFKVDNTEFAAYLNATYAQDSMIGHSSVFNSRVALDRALVGNPNWNPYLGRKPLVKGVYATTGFDAVYRTMMNDSLFSAEAQFDFDTYSNSYGSVRTYDARLQASLATKPYEYAVRVAALVPDGNMTYGTTTLTGTATSGTPNIPLVGGSQPIYEITPAFTWWIKDWSKVILQVSALINTPVSLDTAASGGAGGAYVSVQQPDQTGYKGTVTRQTIPEVRLMWQTQF